MCLQESNFTPEVTKNNSVVNLHRTNKMFRATAVGIRAKVQKEKDNAVIDTS